MIPRRVAALFVVLAACVGGSLGPASHPLRAHPLDPSLLELRETGDGVVEVTWRTPLATLGDSPPEPRLPCEAAGEESAAVSDDGRALVRRWRIRCSGEHGAAGALVDRRVEVANLRTTGSDALLRWIRPGDEGEPAIYQQVLSARDPAVVLPRDPSRLDVAADYLRFGFDHILEGFDHLAFVFGLFLLVAGRRLVLTVTAFTVGHSLTLALVVLGALVPPSSLVETAIAASILVLAVELARPDAPERSAEETKADESWLRRRPWLVAGGFGLLHGLGFAGALRETGLPDGEIPLALAAFNVGIELGQLAFVAVLVLLAALAALVVPFASWHSRARSLAVYGLGTLAAFWTLERFAGLF